MSFPSRKRSTPVRLLAVAGGTFALAAGVAVMAPHASAATAAASSGVTRCQLDSHDLHYGKDSSGKLTFDGDGSVDCQANSDEPALKGTARIEGMVDNSTCEGTDTGGSAIVDVKWSDGEKTVTKFDNYQATSDEDVVMPTLKGKNTADSTRFAGEEADATGLVPNACEGANASDGNVSLSLVYQSK